MRSVCFIAVAALLIPAGATAQQKPGPEGLACFENLPTPEYPESALQARVDGSVWSTTHVSAQGTVEKIDTQVVSAWNTGSKLLTPPVEKAIRAAKINPACDGKTVSVVFRYQLHGEATAEPKVTSRTEKPNLMWIESQPATRIEAHRKSATKS